MGAAYKNDIKQITNIYKPNISIISEMLPQHLATFKDMNTLITEKMNIIANMKEKGTIIVNNDNQNIKNNIEKYNIHNNKIIKIGLNMDNDIYAFDIKVSINSLYFKIYNSLSENTFEINSNLVGRHNIYNILIVFATLFELNIPEQEIIEVIQSLQNHENRLEVKHFNNLTLLNDSYNSNQKGFMSALEILGLAKDKKIIITPGIVDSSKEINEYIAKEITRKCDFCYLISNKNIKYYINIFKQLNYNQYTIKKSFKDAFNDIKEEKATVLIENDLTDFYYL
jgi:UDP-N-acetylmuramoyl-tripeptide--D-alanyl-D-alanine ligase